MISKKFYSLLSSKSKFFLYILIILSLLVGFFETIGIGTILPLVKFLLNEEYLAENLKIFSNYFKIEIQEAQFQGLFFFIIIMIFFLKNLLFFLLIMVGTTFCKNFRLELSNKLYENLLNQDYIFHLQHSPRDLIKNINVDIENLRISISHVIYGMADFIIALFIMFFLFYYNFEITLYLFLSILLLSFFYKFFYKKKLMYIGEQRFINFSKFHKITKDTFVNFKIISILGVKKFFVSKFKIYNENFSKYLQKQDVSNFLPRVMIELTMITLVTLFFMYIIFVEKSLEDTLSIFGIYSLAFFRLAPSFNRIILSLNQKNIMKYTLDNIFFILNKSNLKKEKVFKNIDNVDFKKNNININIESIKFKNVSFNFLDNKKILDNVSVQIKNKDFVGIIGQSGSGKSTFINLLLGILRPGSGSVKLNDKFEVSECHQLFTNKMAYVPQKIDILESSIIENIAFGVNKEDINIKKINEVIKKSELTDFVKNLPDGLHTELAEQHINVSGGELQRIGLARSLYLDSDVIVFDEATNALDFKTEKKIIDLITNSIVKTKIVILVSHKIENLANTDYILKVENKKVYKQ